MPTQQREHNFGSLLANTLQSTGKSVASWSSTIHQMLNNGKQTISIPASLSDHSGEQKSLNQLKAWHENSTWIDKPAVLKVTVPKGTLCELYSNFQIGLPPDNLYDILTDPGNKRVFKNIKEVTYRKVLEDTGHCQLIEVEQAAIWRFLCFSGTLLVRVFVNQNRQNHQVSYHLSREGFMKKFEGSWDIRPLYVDAPQCNSMASPESDPVCLTSRVASDVTLKQVVQPKLVPPPPISWYVRGITTKQTETLLHYLQVEAKRLREECAEAEHSEP